MSDETLINMMKRNNPSMFNYIREKVNEGIRSGDTRMQGQEGFLGMLGDKE